MGESYPSSVAAQTDERPVAISPDRVALVAVRSLDPRERELVHEIGAHVYTMSEVDRLGVEPVIREALERVAGPGFVHVSLDMDALDPDVPSRVHRPR